MVLKSKLIVDIDIYKAQEEFDKFLLTIRPDQYRGHSENNGIIRVVYDDSAPDRIASLNMNKVSDQPLGDPTIDDHPKNTATYIDNSCSEV